MLNKYLLGMLLSILSLTGFAQTFSVKGKIQDTESGKSLGAATVQILNQADSVRVRSMAAADDGSFSFDGLPAGRYFVLAEYLGYQQGIKLFRLDSADVDLGNISIKAQGNDLAGVVVVARTPPVVNKADTAQYAASQYKVNPDASTEDLIKKMPGIQVARDGSVTAQGETVKKVTIDGKDFFGDDASAALKNLPSEVVDKIQVYDRLSDQAQLTGVDDGNSVKAINVVTKSGIKNGQFGRLYAGYGTDNRYTAGGNASFFKNDRRISFVGNFNNINIQNFSAQDLLGVSSNGGGRGGGGRGGGGGGMMGGFGGQNNFLINQANGISRTNAFGINYSDKWGEKVTATGSYFFNNSRNTNLSQTNTQTFIKDSRDIFSSSYSDPRTTNTNHRFNLRLEYKIDSLNSLFVIPSLNFQNNNSQGYTDTRYFYSAADSISTARTNSDRESNGYNLRNTLMYRHLFANNKRRSIVASFNTTFNKNNSNSEVNSDYRFFRSAFITDSTADRLSDNQSNGYNIGGNLAYTEPVGKFSVLQFEYNPSVQKNNADQKTFQYDGAKYSLFDTSLSNKFDNTITTHNGGISYRYNPSRDEMLMLGANLQNSRLQSDRSFPVTTSVDQRFTNVLPRVMYFKKFTAASSLRLFYRGNVDFPSVNQLQDVITISNNLSVSMGNPFLKQAYSHMLMSRYSYANTKTGHNFFFGVGGQLTNNYIANALYIPVNGDSVLNEKITLVRGASQLTKPVNLDGYKNARAFATYSFPVKALKSNLTFSGGYNFASLPGLTNNVAVTTDNNVLNAGLNLASNISEYVDFNLSYTGNFNNARTKTGAAISRNNYTNHVTNLTLNLLNKQGWFLQNDITNQIYLGLSAGNNQNFWLWNAAIGKKFLAKKQAEIKLSAFDLLGQNQAITRNVTANYIEDIRTTVLQRYFLLTFTYNLRNFGTAKTTRADEGDGPGRHGQGAPGRPMF